LFAVVLSISLIVFASFWQDSYHSRPLPHVIGTREFLEDDSLGLNLPLDGEASSSESESESDETSSGSGSSDSDSDDSDDSDESDDSDDSDESVKPKKNAPASTKSKGGAHPYGASAGPPCASGAPPKGAVANLKKVLAGEGIGNAGSDNVLTVCFGCCV
jgi:hypothetical protein